jgi:hypothetical protein
MAATPIPMKRGWARWEADTSGFLLQVVSARQRGGSGAAGLGGGGGSGDSELQMQRFRLSRRMAAVRSMLREVRA